jgi:hypothetical protein
MASRPILSPQSVITNANMTTTVTSLVTIIQNTSKVSYDISWTGTPVGTFSVQVSNTNPGNWTPLTLSAPTTATGAPGNGFIDIDQIASYAIRLQYAPTSGTGTLNATIAGKVG